MLPVCLDALTEKTLNEKILRKESLCETRARNTCYLLTITNQTGYSNNYTVTDNYTFNSYTRRPSIHSCLAMVVY